MRFQKLVSKNEINNLDKLHIQLNMDANELNTYTTGYELTTIRSISKRDMVLLCRVLSKEFNEFYNTNTHQIEPEAITEGGFVFRNFNNRDAYKSMRLGFGHYPNLSCKYPQIPQDVLLLWENDESVVIPDGTKLSTILKSFRNAPKWTIEELEIFNWCLREFGIESTLRKRDRTQLLKNLK